MDIIDYLNKDRKVKKSVSTTFIMPLLANKYNLTAEDLIKEGFENCYLTTDNNIVIAYKKEVSLNKYNTVIHNDDKVYYIYDFKQNTFSNDIDKILEGKYSEISSESKKIILDFWDLNKEDNFMAGILYKTELGELYKKNETKENDEFVEGEFFPKPSKEFEIINI